MIMPYRYDDDDYNDDGRDAVWILGLIYINREREVRYVMRGSFPCSCEATPKQVALKHSGLGISIDYSSI